MDARTDFVTGLMFSPGLDQVVLLTKNRPDFLAGRLTLVGGGREAGESAPEAMAREFLEETGIDTHQDDWTEFAEISHPARSVRCFVAVSALYAQARSTTDEPVSVLGVADALQLAATAPHKVAQDLIALIGLALGAIARPALARIELAPQPAPPARPAAPRVQR